MANWARHTLTPTQRGYGQAHRKLRHQLITNATPHTPCARCHQPLGPNYHHAHLGHTDDHAAYIGLEHPICNITDAARRARARQTTTQLHW